MSKPLDSRTLRRIVKTLEADPLVAQVRDLTFRSAGRYVFVEATVTVRTDDLEKAHATARRLEAGVRDEPPGVDHMSLHLEPRRTDVLTVCLPLEVQHTDQSDIDGALRELVAAAGPHDADDAPTKHA